MFRDLIHDWIQEFKAIALLMLIAFAFGLLMGVYL